jgi:Domain of unknown function (DUF4136)
MNLTTSSTKLVALALAAVLASACQATTSAPQVQTVKSSQTPFARYHTFTFGFAEGPPQGTVLSAGSLDVENRLGSIVRTALVRRGYAENAGQADLVVRIAAGTAEINNLDVGGYTEDFLIRQEPTPGLSLAIDVYDAATKAHVWHGATLVDGSHFDDKVLERIVTNAFAEFPRGDQSAASPTT